ncbi:restriction endonuclease subunit S [Mulberry dwarf phytoplasma]|uniref:restriction endonuclease subunit S n=1 Tax=Mulberry dwarf phytoplasma TaxID=186171 RepID=UPI001D11C07D|nr:restriction endonuclease subunit S [Mulberry dwarf phytoplasma]
MDSGEKKPPKSPNGKYPIMGGNKKTYSKGKSERANQNAGTITIGRDSGYVHYHEKPFWALSNCFIINRKNIKDLEYQTLYKLLQKNQKGIKNLKNLNKKGKNIKTKDLEFFLNNILNVF